MVVIPSRDQLKTKAPRIDLFAQRQAAASAGAGPSSGAGSAGSAQPSSGCQPAQCAPSASVGGGGAVASAPRVGVALDSTSAPVVASAGATLFNYDLPPPQAPSAQAAGVGGAAAPPPPASNKILVSHRQRGNKVIDHILNVGWEYAHIAPDYQLGQSTVALFLSLRYHLLHPQYILRRVEELHKGFTLCVILVLVDMEDHQRPIQEITRAMLVNKCTVVLAWSNLEAARYLETLKAYQAKPADMLQQRPVGDYTSALHDCLGAIRAINKSDVFTLSTTVGSLREILLASEDQLALCPGLGEKKISLLQSAFTDPFLATSVPVGPEVGTRTAAEPPPDDR